jgi:hypothetical protein
MWQVKELKRKISTLGSITKKMLAVLLEDSNFLFPDTTI